MTTRRTGLDDTRRAALGLKLTAASIRRTREALRACAPEADDLEIGLRFVELQYGRDLAERVRAYLARRAASLPSSSTR